MTPDFSSASQFTLVPLAILAGTAVFLLFFDLRDSPHRLRVWVSLTGLVVAAALIEIGVASGQRGTVQGTLGADGVTALLTLFSCSLGALSILIESQRLQASAVRVGAPYALTLLAVCGMLVVAQSLHLLSVVLGLAVVHVAVGALLRPRNAWHYWVTTGTGLAIFLFGVALLYGATGTLHIHSLSGRTNFGAPRQGGDSLATLGIGLIIVGVGIPMNIVPLDAGSKPAMRTSRAAAGFLLSIALPATSIAALGRLEVTWRGRSEMLLAILGALNIVLGYARAASSRSFRGIIDGITAAQSGLMLLGLVAIPTAGWDFLFYVLVNSALNLSCLWAILAHFRHEAEGSLSLDGIAGSGRQQPWLVGALTLCLLNLAGVPPLSGGIVLLLGAHAGVTSGHAWIGLAIVTGALLAWLLAGRWVFSLWMRPAQARPERPPTPEIAVAAVVPVICMLLLGLYTERVLSWAQALSAGP